MRRRTGAPALRLGFGLLLLLGAYASATGCVGDDPGGGNSSSDAGGTDTGTSSDGPASGDTGSDGGGGSDGSGDAAVDADAGCSVLAPFKAPQQVTSINTAGQEHHAWFSPDEKTTYVTSVRPDAGVGGVTYDIFSASRLQRTDPFPTLTVLANINSATANDQAATVTSDGLTLYLASNRPGLGSFDIYVATRNTTSADFGSLSSVTNVNGPAFDYPNWISPDGDTLYFESGRDNPIGAIYRSARVAGTFQAPVAVSDLNSASGEGNAVLSSDQLVVYFYSLRAGTGVLGGGDIWMATRTDTSGTFTSLTPLTTINSTAVDVPNWASPDGCRLYFHSLRPGSGSDDIWMAER